MGISNIWSLIEQKRGADIQNWTAFSGPLGDTFRILKVTPTYVEVEAPGAVNVQHIPRKDFDTVIHAWGAYLAGHIPRHKLRDQTRFSKYIISILHAVLDTTGALRRGSAGA